jgi:DNA-directed RNA polymerase subunit RPC12/RpoP
MCNECEGCKDCNCEFLTEVYCPACSKMAGYWEEIMNERGLVVCPHCGKIILEPVE